MGKKSVLSEGQFWKMERAVILLSQETQGQKGNFGRKN